jgi:glycerate 2-kinase
MAAAALEKVGGAVAGGYLVTTSNLPVPEPVAQRLRTVRAGHPLPDESGIEAACGVEAMVGGLQRDDVLLVLLSGGASALLPAPVAGVSPADKAATTSLLLRSGATITELNAVRKHLSRLKGGRLASLAQPARVLCLALSDVAGDDPATIGSGPCSPDPSTFLDALSVLRRRQVLGDTPHAVRRHLEAGAGHQALETPKPGASIFRRVTTRVIGGNGLCVVAMARAARRLGYRPLVLTRELEGEARETARVLVSILGECVKSGRPARPPVCLIAAGETTVTVQGPGQGGRNQELAVAAAAALLRFPAPALVAALATDGVDGRSDAAGGVVDDLTVAGGAALGLQDPRAFLQASDSRNYLGPCGGLILTGPTGTNVGDLVVLLAGRP